MNSSHSHPGYNDAGFALGYRLANVLPHPVCRFIGSTLALASYHTQHRAREALMKNLHQVTGLTGAPLKRIARRNFQNFGRMIADYFYCSNKHEKEIRPLLDEWHGLDALRQALAQGKGVILVTGHLGNWELGGILLALDGWPINVVTLEEPTTQLTMTRDAYRKRVGIRTIPVGESKNTFAFLEMIAALKRNEIVCMLVDRPYGETGIPVTFFGRSTHFSSAPALLHQHTGAAILPAFVLHNARGRYNAIAEPMLDLVTLPDRREVLAVNTQKIATAFEKIIGPHADQWYNFVPIWP